jgi:hypothetical protein
MSRKKYKLTEGNIHSFEITNYFEKLLLALFEKEFAEMDKVLLERFTDFIKSNPDLELPEHFSIKVKPYIVLETHTK